MAESTNFDSPIETVHGSMLDDDEEEEIGFDDACMEDGVRINADKLRELANTGEAEFELQHLSLEKMKEEQESSYRNELTNIANVMMRNQDEIENAEHAVPMDIREDFEKYKTMMQDVTPDNDGGVMKRILRTGHGAAAALGSSVKYHYSLEVEGQDEPFDSSQFRGRAVRAKLGNCEVIAGVELALCTMKEGEMSDFILDPAYAFGPFGCPPRVPRSCPIRATITLLEIMEEDPVDAMSNDERRTLTPREMMDYFVRKLEAGKKIFNRGKTVAAINRYKDARAEADLCWDIWSDNDKEELKDLRIRLYKNLAVCYMKVSMMSKTAEYLKRLERMDVSDAKTHFLWAKVYQNEGEYEKAINACRIARELEPGNAEIRRMLVELQKDKRERDAALKEQAQRMFASDQESKPIGQL